MVFKTNLILSFFQNSYYLSWWQLCTHLSHSLNQLHNGDDGMLFKQSLISLICWVFLATFSFSLCFKSSKPIKMSCPIRFEQTLCKSVFYSSEMNIQTRKCSMQSKTNKQTEQPHLHQVAQLVLYVDFILILSISHAFILNIIKYV